MDNKYHADMMYAENLIIGFQWVYRMLYYGCYYAYSYIFGGIMYLFTGKTEIQRLLDPNIPLDMKKVFNIKKYIIFNSTNSPNLTRLRKLLESPQPYDLNEFVNNLSEYSKIGESDLKTYAICLNQTNIALGILTKYKNGVFSYDNPKDVALLRSLWRALSSDKLENLTSSQWKYYGFQCDDPSSDFRGMGLLGLMNLVYLSQNDREFVDDIIKLDNESSTGYPFAITSINISMLAYKLVLKRQADNIFCSIIADESREDYFIDRFNIFYTIIFHKFHELWIKTSKKNLLDFPRILGLLEDELYSSKCQDKIN